MIDRAQLIVVLESEPLITMIIADALEEAGFTNVAVFNDDSAAANFIHENASAIVGVIQNTVRGGRSASLMPKVAQLRSATTFSRTIPFDAGRFYFHVIDLLIPWTNVIFSTGWTGDRETRDQFERRHDSERYWEGQEVRKGQEGRRMINAWSARDRRINALAKPFTWEQLIDAVERWTPVEERALDYKARLLQPVNEEIAVILSRQPDLMHSMDPRQFEEFVAFIFQNHGFETELTAQTRDGGYDIRAVRADGANEFMLVEVKRYALNRPVGVGVVRALYGVKHLMQAARVALVTSSFVSRDAQREFSRTIPHELELWDYHRLEEFCSRYAMDLFEQ